LVHQLTELIEQVSVSGKKWADDKAKIETLESRIRELEKRDQILEDSGCWGPLPPYRTAVKPTAPVGDFDPNEEEVYDLAPITRGGTLQEPVARYKPFTPGERQQVLASLGKLQPRSNNGKFWAELDTLWVGHQLHLRDIHQLVRAACPQDKWRLIGDGTNQNNAADQVRLDDRGGRWTYATATNAEIEAMMEPFNRFKAEVQRVLGNAPTNWSRITNTKQRRGEDASEFGERLFRVYQECSGVPDPARTDRAFLQTFKDGLSPAHQKILKMGVLSTRTYDELVEWASGIKDGLDEKPYPRIKQEIVSANGRGVKQKNACHNCGKTGHFVRNCRAPKGSRKTGLICSFCNKDGHTEATCWSKHGQPSQASPVVTEGGN